MVDRVWRHGTTQCPYCDHRKNLTTNINGDNPPPPGPGSLVMCSNCGAICAYTKRASLRKATPHEHDIAMAVPGAADTLRVIQERQKAAHPRVP